MELGPSNIRANAILPGALEGARVDRVMGAKAKALGVSVEKVRKRAVSNISLRRMVSAQDIADMALFLVAPSGRTFLAQLCQCVATKQCSASVT
jgi:NAD(P)-dependent dehydrogenase (short-subunit alcohol dehydrogenase family)